MLITKSNELCITELLRRFSSFEMKESCKIAIRKASSRTHPGGRKSAPGGGRNAPGSGP